MGRDAPVIRSRANPLLKRVGAVRAGKLDGVVLEGERLVRDALGAGLELDALLVGESRPALAEELGRGAAEVRVVADGILAQASVLTRPPLVLALARTPPSREARDLDLEGDALLLAVAGVSDPGNLGALARSAEAAGARALLVAEGGARPFGEKALRGSMGSLLRLPVVHGVGVRALSEDLGARGVRQVLAATRGGTSWRAFDWSGPLAVWVGGETGTALDLAGAVERVSIPMAGEAESLNVTVAASLLLFAAGRESP